MRRSILLCLGTILFSVSTLIGQEAPRVEVFGGYSYLNIDTNGLTDRISANGWEASVFGGINRYFGIEGSVSGHYKNNVLGSGIDARDYAFLGGPRFNYKNVFVHAMFGGDHLTGTIAGLGSASQNGFAMAFGGGGIAPINQHWGVRASADFVLSQHNVLGGARFDQNNFRFSAGIVYRFGSFGGARHRAETSTSTSQEPAAAGPTHIAALGVTVVPADNRTGVQIVEIDPNGPAAKAGMRTQDVIATVNGRDVRTVSDLNRAIDAAKDRQLKVRYMFLGTPQYQTIEITF